MTWPYSFGCSRHPEQAEIRYEDGKRLVRNWRHLPAPQSGAVPWKDEGVYLLTGGAGGIGLIAPGFLSVGKKGMRLPRRDGLGGLGRTAWVVKGGPF